MPERSGTRRVTVETSAGGVVYRRVGNDVVFLLIRDPYDNWGLPKGHMEAAETPAETAVREVAEETGLTDLNLRGDLPTVDWYFRLRGRLIHKHCHFFLMESPTGEPRPERAEGISECVWCPSSEVLETVTYDNVRRVLRLARERTECQGGAASAN